MRLRAAAKSLSRNILNRMSHITLSMLALAFLAILRARLKAAQMSTASSNHNKRSETVTLGAISVQELRRLIVHLQKQHPPRMSFHWAWPIWRRAIKAWQSAPAIAEAQLQL